MQYDMESWRDKMNHVLEEIKDNIKLLEGITDLEENVKAMVVVPTLKALGYDKDCQYDYEHTLCRGKQRQAC